ncbi:MAG TPA: hypothetical protein VD927_05470, partial [Chryseosolibacter sp.]|nr:hypothetical protein [Chryseosolibacter sp.]
MLTSRQLYLIFFSFITTIAVAQTELLQVAFPITEVSKDNTKHKIRIEFGSNAGIAQGSTGEVWGIAGSDIKNHVANLGIATVVSVADDHAYAELSTSEKVLKSDLIFLNIPFKTGYRSPYHFLTAYGIQMFDSEGKPFYALPEIIARDGHELQTEKFLLMAGEAKAFGKNLAAKKDSRKVKGGPHAGKLLSEALTITDTLTVWNYLYHTFMSYEETMGQRFVFNEAYSKYVEEGDIIL